MPRSPLSSLRPLGPPTTERLRAATSLSAIGDLVVPSAAEWSVGSWWAGRRVLVPSFVFPLSRAQALQSLLASLRCQALDDWSDGAAVDVCVVDEEDALREVRSRRQRLSTSPALTLSTTLSQLSRAVAAAVPVLSLTSFLASGERLLRGDGGGGESVSAQSAEATLLLESASGSHAPFVRSWAADVSGLPSHPLLWLSAHKQAAPFLRPRNVRPRLQPPSQQCLATSAADSARVQAEELARERERERSGRHTCEVCGVQFSGVVEAHIDEATHARKQREQNWQPLVELAQRYNRQRRTRDERWRQSRQRQQRTHSHNSSPAVALIDVNTNHCDVDTGGGRDGGDSGVRARLSCEACGGVVQRSPSGLCVWHSNQPPPARCFANLYADDVLWAAPQQLHRTLALDSPLAQQTQEHFQHYPTHELGGNDIAHTDNSNSGTEAAVHAGALQQRVYSPHSCATPAAVREEQPADLHSQCNESARRSAAVSDESGEWSGTAQMEPQPAATEPASSSQPNASAALTSADDTPPDTLSASLPAVQDGDGGEKAAEWLASGRARGGALKQRVSCLARSLSERGPRKQRAEAAHGRQCVERHHNESTVDSSAQADLSAASTGSVHCHQPALRDSSQAVQQRVAVSAASAVQLQRQLASEQRRLAQYDRHWALVRQDDSRPRTRAGCSQHSAEAAAEAVEAEAVEAVEASAVAESADSMAPVLRSHWSDLAPARVTRSTLRQLAVSGGELLGWLISTDLDACRTTALCGGHVS